MAGKEAADGVCFRRRYDTSDVLRSDRKRSLWSIWLIICAVVAPSLSGCNSVIDGLVLHPNTLVRFGPTYLGYNTYDEINLPVGKDGHIALWHVHTTGERKGIVVDLAGLADNKSRYVPSLPVVVDDGWDMIIFDYQGFGDSTGEATLQGAVDSSRAVFEYALSQDDTVVGYGFSFGTAVLARIAADYDLAACIFDGTLDLWESGSLFVEANFFELSFQRLFDIPFILGAPPDYDTKRWIQLVDEPKLFIQSKDDHVNPYRSAREIFDLAPEPKLLYTTQGEHMTYVFIDPVLYHSVVNGWLDSVVHGGPVKSDNTDPTAPPEPDYTPDEVMLPAGENGQFAVGHIHAAGERRGIVVALSGQSGNKRQFVPGVPAVVDGGWDMILPNFNEIDGGSARAKLEGTVNSARVAFDYALSQTDSVVGFGFGAGATALAQAAADYDLSACVFFDTPRDDATEQWITTVDEPKLFVHSADDAAHPYEDAWAVFELAPQPKFFFTEQAEPTAPTNQNLEIHSCIVDGWLKGVVDRGPVHSEHYHEILLEEMQYYDRDLLSLLPYRWSDTPRPPNAPINRD